MNTLIKHLVLPLMLILMFLALVDAVRFGKREVQFDAMIANQEQLLINQTQMTLILESRNVCIRN